MTFLSAASILSDTISIGLLAGFAGAVVIAVMLLLLTPLLPLTTWLRDGSVRGIRRLAALQDRLWRSSASAEPARLGLAMREAARERPQAETRGGLLEEFVDLSVLAATLFAGFLLIAVAVNTVGLDGVFQSAAATLLTYMLGPSLVLAAAFPFFVIHNRSQELEASRFRRRVAYATLGVALTALALFALIKSADYLLPAADNDLQAGATQAAASLSADVVPPASGDTVDPAAAGATAGTSGASVEDESRLAGDGAWRSLVEMLLNYPVPFFWTAAALAVAGAAALADRGFYGFARVALYLAGAILGLAVFVFRALVWLLVGVPIALLAAVFALAQALALLPESVVNWLRRRRQEAGRREAGQSPSEPATPPVPPHPGEAAIGLEQQIGRDWEPSPAPAAR